MATTKLNAGQVREDTLTDADNDTLIQVEEGSDEDMIRFDTAGTQRMIIADDGNVGIGVDAPSSTLTVYANASNEYVTLIDNDQSSAGHGMKITSDGTGTGTYLLDIEAASTTLFRFRGDGRLGIGTTTPGQTLTVEGDIGIGTQLVHKGDSDTFIKFDDDEINIEVGGENMLFIVEGAGGDQADKVTINNDLADVDFQVKGTNQANLIRTDAVNDRVGIGTTDPDYTLDVAGNVGFDEYIYHNGDADTYIRFEDDSINIYCGGRQMIKMVEAATDKVTINNGGQDVDVQIKGENEANLFRTDAANDVIGIKTSNPKCSLSVSGSMAIEIRALDNDYDPGTTYAVAATDYLIAVNTRATEQGGINSAITITLPLAADFPGRLLIIKDSGGYADVNNIIVTRAGSDTIDGLDTSVTLSSPAQCKHYASNGISIWMDITG